MSSIKSLEDFYGNKLECQAPLRLNMAEVCENKALARLDPKLFSFAAKTKVGAVPVKAVVGQLRGIADYLEKSGLEKRVMFELRVWEDPREGKR